MKVTIDAAALMNAVDWTTRVSRESYTLVDVHEDGYVVFRAEGDQGMRSSRIQAAYAEEVTDKHTFSLSSPHLIKMMGALSKKKADGPVELDLNDDKASITYGYLKFPVAVMSSLGTLASDREKFKSLGTVDYNDFMDAVKTAKIATGAQLGAVSMLDLTFGKDRIDVMGTDKFTLVVESIPFEKTEGANDSRFLVLPDNCLLKAASERIDIEESDESMKFIFDNGMVATVRKQTAKALNWMKIKSAATRPETRENEKTFTVNRNELLTSADIAISLAGADQIRRVIVLTAENGELGVSSNGNSSPSDKISVDANNDSRTVMQFSHDELKKAIMSVSAEKLMIKYVDDDVPVIFESVLPDGSIDGNVFILTKTVKD